MQDKIVFSEIVQSPQFYFDKSKYIAEATAFIMTGENLDYLECMLNSIPVAYFFKTFYAGGALGDKGYRYKKNFLNSLPIPPVSTENATKVSNILEIRKQLEADINGDITSYCDEIDELVFQIYGITKSERKRVDIRLL